MHGRKNSQSRASAHGAPHAILPFITTQADGVTLAIKLQPRASKNEIGDPLGTDLRVKVTAPPVDAAANEALLRLLADTLGCPRGNVELIRGHTARQKVVKIYGITVADVAQRLVGRKASQRP
jgi:uncharacterized protein